MAIAWSMSILVPSVREFLHVGESGVVIHGHVDHGAPEPGVASLLGPVEAPSDAQPHPTELLGVEVHPVAGVLPPVADRRGSRLGSGKPSQAETSQRSVHGGTSEPREPGDAKTRAKRGKPRPKECGHRRALHLVEGTFRSSRVAAGGESNDDFPVPTRR